MKPTALPYKMLLAVFAATPTQALTMSECSAKFKAAKNAGTLGGMKWNDFTVGDPGAHLGVTGGLPGPWLPPRRSAEQFP